ncbi:N-acetylmuramoyl-L-alanine amidase (EC AmpD [uncultured Gammaproteobacteria bacterium]|jgi:AmpD protein|nr:1,6-anhydro-N-acetylmuramyl-L-alanine amidase [uncultured Gammaproteobacteria bacterium]CAC9442630.1 1,6-anhydro-N-acetylmuramyl-L-alanine amidase [uncultured Gammaproteobacteria bacterium]VVH67008.1 N-acetylmuramoyl-L-alanine amidase (EC AmpD [uncultured Gammaproteobacteria bacterium]
MIENHLLACAKQVPSLNYNERPNDKVSLVVIHNISLPPKQFGGDCVEQFFTNQLDFGAHPYFQTLIGIEVSAHLFIKRGGEVIQFVPFNKRAWHAGQSNFKGKENCNDFSIGIELEGGDDIEYTDRQYQALNDSIKALKSQYLITDIVGHSDIAPGRKTDPGDAFNWSKIK